MGYLEIFVTVVTAAMDNNEFLLLLQNSMAMA